MLHMRDDYHILLKYNEWKIYWILNIILLKHNEWDIYILSIYILSILYKYILMIRRPNFSWCTDGYEFIKQCIQ